MKKDLDLTPLFGNTTISHDDQRQLTKNFLKFSEEYSNQKNKEFGLYLLELLKEYPEIIPEKQELNFFFEDIERELKIDMNELEKNFD
jgi:hypothetical protein